MKIADIPWVMVSLVEPAPNEYLYGPMDVLVKDEKTTISCEVWGAKVLSQDGCRLEVELEWLTEGIGMVGEKFPVWIREAHNADNSLIPLENVG